MISTWVQTPVVNLLLKSLGNFYKKEWLFLTLRYPLLLQTESTLGWMPKFSGDVKRKPLVQS